MMEYEGWSGKSHQRRKRTIMLVAGILVVAVLAVGPGVLGYFLGRGSVDEAELGTVAPTISTEKVATQPTVTPTLSPNEEIPARFFNLTPRHYDILMEPDIYSGDDVLNGTVTMFLAANTCLNVIMFNIQTINISDYKVVINETSEDVTGGSTSVSYADREQVFGIKLKRKVCNSDALIKVTVFYVGTLNQPMPKGLYSSLVDENDNSTRIASTHLEPKSARKAFPCLDDPLLKATFSISIIHRRGYQALSNMPIEEVTNERPGFLKTRFQKTPHRMSTYLVAIAVVKNYTSITEKVGLTQLGVLGPEQFRGELDFANNVTKFILKFFNQYMNFSYDFPKVDQIALPYFGSGAMENWGLITYRLSYLLYSRQRVATKQQQRITAVIGHELAHQWFGNVVTMDWWSEIWLNEAFSSLYENLGIHEIYVWNHFNRLMNVRRPIALKADEQWYSQPIRVPVKTNTPRFGSITYSKGASVLRMLSMYLGRKSFQQGIRNYIYANQYANADTDALWDAMDKAKPPGLPAGVKKLMTNWTDLPGFPLITVNLTRKDNVFSIGLHQQRYLRIGDGGELQDDTAQSWIVPITYVVENESTVQTHLLSTEYDTIVCPSCTGLSWIKVNWNGGGFYRVNYDDICWNALTQQLHANHTQFAWPDRLTLIDDAFSLAQNDRLPYEKALNLIEYIFKERSVDPVMAAIPRLSYISEMLWNDINAFRLWSNFIIHLFSPLARYLTWTDNNNVEDVGNKQMLRSILFPFLCWHGDQSCLDESRSRFQIMKKQEDVSPSDPGWVSPNLLSVVLTFGQKTAEDSEFIWKIFMESMHPHTKEYFAQAIGFGKDPRLLGHYLDRLLLISPVRYRAVGAALDSFVINPCVHAVVMRWLQNVVTGRNITADSTLVQNFARILSLAEKLNTESDLRLMRSILEHVPFITSVEELIKRNINWVGRHKQEIMTWLEAREYL